MDLQRLCSFSLAVRMTVMWYLSLPGYLRHAGEFGERDVVAQDVCESGITVFALERCCTEEHLIDQNAEGPPIYRAGVTTAFDHLWGDIFFGSDERVGPEVGYTGFGVDSR